MKNFVITEEQRDEILREISHAPAMYVINAMNVLGKLPTVNLQGPKELLAKIKEATKENETEK